jgi:hypothetical protein
VRFAGSAWPLIFDFWAIRKLGQRYVPEDTGLDWLRGLMTKVAAGDIDALCVSLWAGMLRENPTLTFEETLTLLDEAAPFELVTLPAQILGALQEAFGVPESTDGDGSPWDWEVALATWIKEWGRSEEEFWRSTFRTFTSISNGLSRLYERSRQGTDIEVPPEGYSLMDLLTKKGR